jgi:hypothetical protein
MTEAHEPNVKAVTQGAALGRAGQLPGSDDEDVGSPLFEGFRSKPQTRVRWFQWPFTLAGWIFMILGALAVPSWVMALANSRGRGTNLASSFVSALLAMFVFLLLGSMILMLGRALRAIEQRLERIEGMVGRR